MYKQNSAQQMKSFLALSGLQHLHFPMHMVPVALFAFLDAVHFSPCGFVRTLYDRHFHFSEHIKTVIAEQPPRIHPKNTLYHPVRGRNALGY